jgi:hypothetical protein
MLPAFPRFPSPLCSSEHVQGQCALLKSGPHPLHSRVTGCSCTQRRHLRIWDMHDDLWTAASACRNHMTHLGRWIAFYQSADHTSRQVLACTCADCPAFRQASGVSSTSMKGARKRLCVSCFRLQARALQLAVKLRLFNLLDKAPGARFLIKHVPTCYTGRRTIPGECDVRLTPSNASVPIPPSMAVQAA